MATWSARCWCVAAGERQASSVLVLGALAVLACMCPLCACVVIARSNTASPLACCCRWRPAGNQRSVPVLLACNISSSLPGDYNITFSVTNSAGLSASVVRRVTIKAACPEGEALCPDQVRDSCLSLQQTMRLHVCT